MTAKEANNKLVQKAFSKAIMVGVGLNIALTLISLLFTEQEFLGSIFGALAALIITLPTLITAYWGIKGSFNSLAATVLGTWLVKMIAVIALLIYIQNANWLNLQWVGFALLLGAVVPTVMEIYLLLRSRPKLEI